MADDNTVVAGFPVYALAFTKGRRLLLAGGGGAGRSGVKNKIVLYKVDEDEWKELAEHAFSNEEDAPMSLAVHPEDPNVFVCGANSLESEVEKGENKNLRIFKINDEKLSQSDAVKTISSKTADDYQKAVAFSPNGKLIATGSSNGELAVLKYPSLKNAFPTSKFGEEEIYDLDFSPDSDRIAVLSDSSVRILLVDGGNEFQAIQKPTLNKRIECKFRCLRYGRGESERYLMTVVNAADRRRGFICKWDTATWTLAAKAAVSKRAITALCVSSNGQLLGFGSQDLSVGVVDAATLRLLKTYQEVHGLPPTVVSFDEEAQNLVSASADTTFRMTELPEKYPSGSRMLSVGWPFFIFSTRRKAAAKRLSDFFRALTPRPPFRRNPGLFTALPSVNYLILVVLALLVLGLGVHIEHEVSNGATLIDVVSSIAAKFEGIGNVTTRPWIMSDEL